MSKESIAIVFRTVAVNHSNVPVYYSNCDYISNYTKTTDIIDTIYKDI